MRQAIHHNLISRDVSQRLPVFPEVSSPAPGLTIVNLEEIESGLTRALFTGSSLNDVGTIRQLPLIPDPSRRGDELQDSLVPPDPDGAPKNTRRWCFCCLPVLSVHKQYVTARLSRMRF